MLSIIHGVTGAYLGTVCPQPLVYVPAAVALHFLEDAVPHWDVGTGMHSGKRQKLTAFLLELIDLGLMVGVVFWLFQKTIPSSWAEVNWPAWIGALAGISVDLVEFPNSFFGWQPALLRPMMKLHDRLHNSAGSVFWGLLPQVLVLGAVIYLSLRLN